MYSPKMTLTALTLITLSPLSFAVSTTDLSSGVTPGGLVAELIDVSTSNITYSNIRYQGANKAAGIFAGGIADGLGIERGIILSSGYISNAASPNKCYKTTGVNNKGGDSNLNAIVDGLTLDAAVLEFDFVPTGDRLEFNYVFASEEYNEWVGSAFNDVFAFFLDGVNIALIPNTTTAVAINSVSKNSNRAFYKDNAYPAPDVNSVQYVYQPCQAGSYTPLLTEFDGLTTVLTATAKVVPGKTHHIKLAVADRGDYSLDSAVFIQGKSFAAPIPVPTATALISPVGTLTHNLPTYSWLAVTTATTYQLQVQAASGQMFSQVYTAAEANCAGGICTVTPNWPLANGAAQATVLPANSSGAGPWSVPLSFTVAVPPPPPGATTLIAPATTLTTNVPAYTWNAVATATAYQLQVTDANGQIFKQWYTAADANCTSGNICTVTPNLPLPNGVQSWQVQTSNTSGAGAWSTSLTFTVAVPPPPPPPVITTCRLYGVQDDDLNDSQLFVSDPETQTNQDLGTVLAGYDLEALDAQPLTKELYVASSHDAAVGDGKGALYKISTAGIVTPLGHLHWPNGQLIHDISGLAFNPNTNVLWGWAEGQGLFRVTDMEKQQAELRWANPSDYGDLAWNRAGTYLYLVSDDQLWGYNGEQVTSLCYLPADSKAEGLTMTDRDALLMSVHGHKSIYALDTTQPLVQPDGQCALAPAAIETVYDDIEGIAWVCTVKQ